MLPVARRLLPIVPCLCIGGSLLLAHAPAAAQAPDVGLSEEVVLRIGVAEGDVLQQQTVMDMQMTMEVNGQPIETEALITVDTTLEGQRVDADAGHRELSATIDRMQMQMTVPMMGKVQFDSKNPEASASSPMAAQLAPVLSMVEEPFKLVVTDRGEVVEMDLPADLPEMGFAEMLESSITMFPEEALAIGGSFTQSAKVTRRGSTRQRRRSQPRRFRDPTLPR